MARRTLDHRLLEKIEREAARSRPTRLTVAALDWERGPDRNKPWAPEGMSPLSKTAAFEHLSDAQKLRYNQYYALQLAEEFVWVERRLIIAALARLLGGPVPGAALRDLLNSFVADERHHDASFTRLLMTARPDLYRRGAWHFFFPPWSFRLLTGLMGRLPRLLSCWVLLTGALEEQTITVSERYKEAGEGVCSLFSSVYLLHAQDEARHCKLDALISEWLAGGQGGVLERVNAWALGFTSRAYFNVAWGCDKPIRYLVSDFPDLRGRERDLIAQARQARTKDYAHILSDPRFGLSSGHMPRPS